MVITLPAIGSRFTAMPYPPRENDKRLDKTVCLSRDAPPPRTSLPPHITPHVRLVGPNRRAACFPVGLAGNEEEHTLQRGGRRSAFLQMGRASVGKGSVVLQSRGRNQGGRRCFVVKLVNRFHRRVLPNSNSAAQILCVLVSRGTASFSLVLVIRPRLALPFDAGISRARRCSCLVVRPGLLPTGVQRSKPLPCLACIPNHSAPTSFVHWVGRRSNVDILRMAVASEVTGCGRSWFSGNTVSEKVSWC